eukprot:scaffold114948_cov69-Phaeocystis_antarctica.AAC.5
MQPSSPAAPPTHCEAAGDSQAKGVAIEPHAGVRGSTSTAHLHLATWKRRAYHVNLLRLGVDAQHTLGIARDAVDVAVLAEHPAHPLKIHTLTRPRHELRAN